MTGKIGKRTKYQQNDVPQLVVEIESETVSVFKKEATNLKQKIDLEEDTILYETPLITEEQKEEGKEEFLSEGYNLSVYDQTYILAYTNYLMKTRPKVFPIQTQSNQIRMKY